MAGSNQSSNLTGMLSQIGGTLGSMGSTYTPSLVRNIENTLRPQVDMQDPESLGNMANWAAQMGRPEEAKIYQDQATETSLTKTKRDALEQEQMFSSMFTNITGQLQEAEAVGDVERVGRLNQDLMRLGQKGLTESQAAKVATQMGSARTSTEKALDNKHTMIAENVRKVDMQIADLESGPLAEDPEQQAKINSLKNWRESMLDNNTVAERYTARAQQDAQAGKALIEQKEAAETKAASVVGNSYTNAIKAGKSPEEALEEAQKQADKLGGTDASVAALENVRKLADNSAHISEMAMVAETLPAAITSVSNKLNRNAEVLGDEIVGDFRQRLADIEKLQKPGNQAYTGQAAKMLEKLNADADVFILQAENNKAARERSETSAYNKTVESLAMARPSDKQLKEVGAFMARNKPSIFMLDRFNRMDRDEQVKAWRDMVAGELHGRTSFYQWDEESRSFALDDEGRLIPLGGAGAIRDTSTASPQSANTRRKVGGVNNQGAGGSTSPTPKPSADSYLEDD